MAPSTKLALANALKKLLQKKFLDDITVKELVEECEVNRQTFYYHFQDIYDLLRWFLEHETSEALRGADCWQDALRAAFRYVQDNHLAIYHVYRSSGRDHLDCHFFQPGPCHHRLHFGGECTGPALPERELDFLADFYMYAIA
ncbi:TetR/AcrR family transcriptional regulator C-terminal domain-containing protein [Flavonifractor plautii]|nr:TetR/AcrR family transcriptional regulator C-terminal domain-containing protein [Flavonifractor plautii]